MTEPVVEPRLAESSLVARNYAQESENRIHADDEARRYGFRGGLVPGVADFAYLTRPALATLGRGWLADGWMQARFRLPVYDGERVTVGGRFSQGDSRLELELRGPGGVCAVGAAGVPATAERPRREDYGDEALPERDARPPATLAELAPGRRLAGFDLALDDELREDWHRRFEPDGHRAEIGTGIHPGFPGDAGNLILTGNVRLGPWIHTESRVDFLATADGAKTLSVRGTVLDSYEKSGHDWVVLDVAIFAEATAVARVEHRAIIRPRQV